MFLDRDCASENKMRKVCHLPTMEDKSVPVEVLIPPLEVLIGGVKGALFDAAQVIKMVTTHQTLLDPLFLPISTFSLFPVRYHSKKKETVETLVFSQH